MKLLQKIFNHMIVRKKLKKFNIVLEQDKDYVFSFLCSPVKSDYIPLLVIQLNKLIRYCKSNNYNYEVIIYSEFDKTLYNGIDRFIDNNHDETNSNGYYSNCKTKYYQAEPSYSMEDRRKKLLYYSTGEFGIFVNETAVYTSEIPRIVQAYFKMYPEQQYFCSSRGIFYSLTSKKFYNTTDNILIAQRRKAFKNTINEYNLDNCIICNDQYLLFRTGKELKPKINEDFQRNRGSLSTKDYIDEETKKFLMTLS